MKDSIDAVTISTPDHVHGIAAMTAMQLGMDVYVQKPLTHNIYEARRLTEAAREYKRVTQMGKVIMEGTDGVMVCGYFGAKPRIYKNNGDII